MAILTDAFSTVLRLSLQVLPVLAVVLVVRAVLLRRSSRRVAFALWAVVGFRLLCPAALPSPLSLFNVPTVQTVQTTAQAIQASAALLGMSGEAEIVPSVRADGNLVLTVTSTRMGGEEAGVDVGAGENSMLSYVGLDSPEITLPSGSLPQGLHPTSAIVTNDGLRLTLAGSRVNLGQL